MYHLLFTVTCVIVQRLWRLLADVKHLISVLISSPSGGLSTGWVFVYACPAYPQYRYLLKHSCVLQHISVCCPWGLTPSGFSFNMCTHLEAASPGCCSFPLILNCSWIKPQMSTWTRLWHEDFPLLWSVLVPLGFKATFLTAGPGGFVLLAMFLSRSGGGSLPSLGLQPQLTAWWEGWVLRRVLNHGF